MNGVKRKKSGFARNGRGGGEKVGAGLPAGVAAACCCCSGSAPVLLRFCYGSATVLLLLPLLFDGTVGLLRGAAR